MTDTQISLQSGKVGNVRLVYILYLVALFIPPAGIVGVVISYLGKSDADALTDSHYTNQISLFWTGLVYMVVGIILSFILVGFFVLLFFWIRLLIRSVKGLQALNRSDVYLKPKSWTF